jgi:hypothetical protein
MVSESPNDPAKRARKGKSNHPENASFAKPRQGVLPRILRVGKPWVGVKGELSAAEPALSAVEGPGTGIFARAPLPFVPQSQNRNLMGADVRAPFAPAFGVNG